jgi:hypothetical protein
MPTYYFTLRKCEDPGYRELCREYPDLDAALVDAQGTARAVVGQRLRRAGPNDLHGSLDIEDDRHRPVARIMLADLVRHIS